MRRTSVLCPVDFSAASQGALRYAAAIAEHFGADLTLVTVNDPLLADVAEMRMGPTWLPHSVEDELQRFFQRTLPQVSAGLAKPTLTLATGKPASEILRVAAEKACDLIVMSSHGLTGIRKLFFGATTERVLRETTIPVLVTPASDPGPASLDEFKKGGRPVLVPLDLISSGERPARVGGAIAEALGGSLLLAHVVEPLRFPVPIQLHLPNVDTERRTRAEQLLSDLAGSIPVATKRETLTAYGDPAEEVAKIARDRNVGLIVMGLQTSALSSPRMGSVTYRVLCLAPTVVLALPPAPAASDT